MNSRCFPRPLDIRDRGNGRTFTLLEPFVYLNGAVEVVVERGFTTDFASIPRLLWRLMPPSGPYNRASVIHDWFYTTRGVSRLVADAIFLEAMAALGVPRWTRWVMYVGVRLGGWASYGKV